jgi:short-subunit dehydrogenase
MKRSETTLITGSSSGIGLALAREFAKHGHPLVLTSRSASELREVAAALSSTYQVEVRTIAADLEHSNAAEEIYAAVENDGLTVDVLVNNAGLGFRGKFWEIPIERDISVARVNIEAIMRLTKLFLLQMIRRHRGRIMNTASVAGFEPGPLMAVYHASKAFVLSFSEALARELEDTGVTVTALCPGATDTDFFSKANMTATRAFQKGPVMSPHEVAEIGYRGCMRGDRTVVTGGANRALVFARRILTESAQAKMNQKFYESVKPEDQSAIAAISR